MNKYDTYKDSGVKWLGEIPSHWEMRKMKFSFEERSQKGFPNLPLLAATQNHGVIRKTDYENRTVEATKSLDTLKLVEIGDFVISLRSFQGGIELCYEKGIISPAYTILRPTHITAGYFKHLGKSPIFIQLLKSMVTGIREGQNIDYGKLRENLLPIPPLSEQTAIANYLDTITAKIDAAIAQQQKMIDLLNERKQIIINRAVTRGLNPNARMKDSGVEWIGEVPEGWGCRKLKSICANTQYSIKTGPFGSQLKGDDIQEFGDVPIYNQRVVIDNDCSLFNSYVSKAKAASLKSFVVNSKDLLITTRGTIGKSTIVPNDAPDGILHPCIIAIRLNFDLCCNEYLQFFFQSIAFNTDMMLKSNATTIEVIYSYNLKECFVPLPPIDEQKQIVEYLNKELVRINQTIDATNNQISLLQERKQIIIDEVVTGKVKVI